MMRRREIEEISFGCVIGLCAWYSEGCKILRSILCKINGRSCCRGEEKRLESADRRR